jgi:AsmA protein
MTSTRRPLRIALIAVAAMIVLVVGAGAIAIARFDPNAYKPNIVQAVKRATGRDLALNGPISLAPSLWPTIRVGQATFSNPPGFSRPQMASLQGMELRLGLVPLLSGRIAIDRLVLIHPDILLETDAAGHPNWQMTPEVSPAAPAGTQEAGTQEPAKAGGGMRTEVSVASISIQDGTLGYRDGRTGKVTTLGVPRLVATAASPDAPLHIDADATYNGTAFSLAGDTGPLSRLQDPAATSAWPVKVTLTIGGATLGADGSMTQPLQGKGYVLAVNGSVPDASALTPLLPGFVPPPLHDVRFAAKVADTGGALPEVSALTLHAGAADLGARVPGLTLDHLDVTAAAVDQPAKLDAAGALGSQPLSLAATTGPLAALMPGAKAAPFPVDATFKAAGATISAKGTIADARALTWVNIALAGKIPDLSALSPLAGQPLPAVQQVAFQGTLTEAAGGFRQGAAVHGLSLTSADGDLSGDAVVGLGGRVSVTASVKSNRIDLDALQAAIDKMPATASGAAGTGAAPAPAPAPGPAPAPQPRRGNRLLSEEPLPFDLLRAADADLTATIGDLRSGGADYKAISGHAVVKDGKLTLDPFAADLPGGHFSGSVAADASPAAPPVHVVLRAPGLALKTILAAMHEPSFATGNLEVYADLRGAGSSPHAIAATLDGSLGLAMAGGTIDNRLLGSLLGKVMDSLNALDLVGKGGTSELKCFGMRMDARHGVGAIRALTLSSSLLTMTGAGTVNLGAETVAMALRPQARVAGTGFVIPVAVSGPIRDPAVKVNDLGAAEANAGSVAGVVLGDATPLGIVGGLLGADKLLGGGTTDICAPALAAARGQAVPAAAAGGSAVKPGAAKPAPVDPGALLKNLFR